MIYQALASKARVAVVSDSRGQAASRAGAPAGPGSCAIVPWARVTRVPIIARVLLHRAVDPGNTMAKRPPPERPRRAQRFGVGHDVHEQVPDADILTLRRPCFHGERMDPVELVTLWHNVQLDRAVLQQTQASDRGARSMYTAQTTAR